VFSRHISLTEISPIKTAFFFTFLEKALTNKDENGKGNINSPTRGKYTIFHALFEAMKEKDKKKNKR
jgi:hypothetical protein